MQYVKDENLTEAQAITLFAAMWPIIEAFAMMSFNAHPVQQALGSGGKHES